MVADEDDAAAFDAMLSFIEACDVEALAIGDVSSALEDGDCLSRGVVESCQYEKTAARLKRAKTSREEQKNTRRATKYTTLLQRRKRAEVMTLRKQAQELEERLALLQRSPYAFQHSRDQGSATTGAAATKSNAREREAPQSPFATRSSIPTGGSATGDSLLDLKRGPLGMEAVLAQNRLRRDSESKNRQLKALMHQQCAMNSAILRLLQKRSYYPVRRKLHRYDPKLLADVAFVCKQNTEALFGPPSHGECPPLVIEHPIRSSAIDSELNQLYRQTESIFELSSDELDEIVCTMREKCSGSLDRHIEVRTSTPTKHSAFATCVLAWRKTCLGSNPELNSSHKKLEFDSYVKKFFLALDRRDRHLNSKVVLNVRHHARRFGGSDRFVTVMYATVKPPVTGLYLREDSWTVITPSPASPKREAVIQTCYRIYTQRSSDNDRPTEEAVDMCKFVMAELGRMTRRNMQAMQSWLLGEASTPFPPGKLVL